MTRTTPKSRARKIELKLVITFHQLERMYMDSEAKLEKLKFTRGGWAQAAKREKKGRQKSDAKNVVKLMNVYVRDAMLLRNQLHRIVKASS